MPNGNRTVMVFEKYGRTYKWIVHARNGNPTLNGDKCFDWATGKMPVSTNEIKRIAGNMRSGKIHFNDGIIAAYRVEEIGDLTGRSDRRTGNK